MINKIYFFSEKTEVKHHELSAFSPTPIIINDIEYPNTEVYFQCFKFGFFTEEIKDECISQIKMIKSAKSPKGASFTGRNWAKHVRPGWERMSIRIHIATIAQIAKYIQHKKYREFLLQTKNNELIQQTTGDSFWGESWWHGGRNEFGKILMRIRKAFSENAIDKLLQSQLHVLNYSLFDEENLFLRYNPNKKIIRNPLNYPVVQGTTQ